MKKINKELTIILIINIITFLGTNLLFNIKYEQVDDFIIYNLYSGLDGTYNWHAVYIHPLLCVILSTLFKICSSINWHSVFLLSMQFICFTIIGYIYLKKHKNVINVFIYAIFSAIFYTTLLLLIQYTSVAALLIATSLFIIIYIINEKASSKKWKVILVILYTLGIMLRIQSLMMVVPFFAIYGIYYFIKYKKSQISKKEIYKVIKLYAVLIGITIVVYLSNWLIYNSNETYKNYLEFNDDRVLLQDLSYTKYTQNKEIFDEIGWNQNDHYLFYTFNFGDENVYNKENLQKIVDYKKSKNEKYNLNLNMISVFYNYVEEMKNTYLFVLILLGFLFISILLNKNKILNISLFSITIIMHLLYIILNRSMIRVVLPEYIIGISLIIYNLSWKSIKINKMNSIITCLCITITLVYCTGLQYNFNYKLDNYSNYRELINYTNNNKENAYLYTVPSLQYRFFAYSVYKMPPKSAFSNLRVMGGWDMYTQNYYDFKQRYNLDGTFLDLLKENVYLIDGDVVWSGHMYQNYIKNITEFIKDHYGIETEYEKVETFNNLYVYKIKQIL
mgnify:CR=1 FL=1